MITLRTGVPGSGKTLTVVAELLAEFDKLGAKDAPPRPVYVHGIPDLALPCLPLPVFAPVAPVKGGGSAQVRNTLEVDWSCIPDGARVVIDEAQHLFPVRGAGSAVPGYVSFLNTHRHRGIDIDLITQHPRLIDGAVRKLIGRHLHFRRLFGGQRHVRYEWDHCSEALGGMAEATKTFRAFPKAAFRAYKSAEVHTKQSFGKPAWMLVPLAAVLGGIWVAPRLVGLVQDVAAGRPLSSASAASAPGQPGQAATVAAPAAPGASSAVALAAARPPRYDDRMPAPASMPYHVGGCWIDATSCRCVTTGEASPRIVKDLGPLCVAIARGELAPHPDRPLPHRMPDQAPGLVAPAPGASAPAPVGATAAEAAARSGLPV